MAHRAFEAARLIVGEHARVCASDDKSLCLLGLIDAALGRKKEALTEARRATELLPTSKDAYDGPILGMNLAVVYAHTGEVEQAIDQLEELLKLPNGPTPGTLRAEPEWDSLRGDARFQSLLKG